MNVSKSNYAIYSYSEYTVAFGYIYDLYCINDQCCSNLGYVYQLPSFLLLGSIEAQSFLGGSSTFQIVEIEVFKVIN